MRFFAAAKLTGIHEYKSPVGPARAILRARLATGEFCACVCDSESVSGPTTSASPN